MYHFGEMISFETSEGSEKGRFEGYNESGAVLIFGYPFAVAPHMVEGPVPMSGVTKNINVETHVKELEEL